MPPGRTACSKQHAGGAEYFPANIQQYEHKHRKIIIHKLDCNSVMMLVTHCLRSVTKTTESQLCFVTVALHFHQCTKGTGQIYVQVTSGACLQLAVGVHLLTIEKRRPVITVTYSHGIET